MRVPRVMTPAFALACALCGTLALRADDSLHRWTVSPRLLRGHTLFPERGELEGRIAGTPRVVSVPESRSTITSGASALLLDGETVSINVSRDLGALDLPAAAMTVEARVLLAETSEWGGFVSALQDNGDFERGFVLGTRGDRFCFAVASESAKRLTYLTAPEPLAKGVWHHVAGTYDGAVMRLFVDGVEVAESRDQKGAILHAPSGVFELASYRDDNEFYRSRGLFHGAALWNRGLSAEEIAALAAVELRLPRPPGDVFGPFVPVHGPFARFVDPTTVRIEWETASPSECVLWFGPDGSREMRRFETGKASPRHAVTVPDIAPETVYRYRMDVTPSPGVTPSPDAGESPEPEILSTASFTFDSSFNYVVPPPPEEPSPYADAERTRRARDAAREIVARSGASAGYCLVLGTEDGVLAYHLALASRMRIVVVEPRADRVRAAREALDRSGLHGWRVSVQQRSLDALDHGRYFANVITSGTALEDGRVPGSPSSWYRHLRPCGGAIVLAAPAAKASDGADGAGWDGLRELPGGGETGEREGLRWFVHRRAPLDGARDWTHQYALPDNSSCSRDELVKGDLEVLWWGRPGPRPMPDRGPRNPAPVAANGRLYVQGDRTLFGMDAYNGTILWSLQIPSLRRANMPRSSSNMIATDTHVIVALGDACVGFNGDTGARDFTMRVPAPKGDGAAREWGYLANASGLLIGTSSKPSSHYVGDSGEWYEDYKSEEIARVTSRRVFAFGLDGESGRDTSHSPRWSHADGVVMNSTITIADNAVYFVESRNPAAKSSESGRLFEDVQSDQYIVALDLRTGEKLWEKYVDFSRCQYMTYMSYADGMLLVAGSDRSKTYHTYAFDTRKRDFAWEVHDEAKKTHHSGHLMHPAIVGGKVYLNKQVYELATGKRVQYDPFDYHGCGTMAASSRAIFHRFEFHGMLDLETGKRTEFLGVRGGCWLGQIPAGGMLLAPESSAGCSCTHSLQISVGFAPRD